MTTFDRFERDLPTLLDELAAPRTPDYFTDIVSRTAATSQRSSWSFPERWLPMSAITERMAAAPRVPWRMVGVIALLLLALAAAALIVGSQQRRLPAPFGPAGNGVIPYVASGDLYVGDPLTGTTRLLVGGPEADAAPRFSPDGTRLAFIREATTGTGLQEDIYVVNDDGSDLRRINSEPVTIVDFGWTPDGRLAVINDVDGVNHVDLFDATGSGSVETIATGQGIDQGIDLIQFRPPDGREILVRGQVDGRYGLYAMNADGTNVHPLVMSTDPEGNDYWGGVVYSADGNRIFYTRPYQFETPTGTCCDLWVMNADGSDPHQFIPNPGAAWHGQPTVSPDGSRIAFWTEQVSVIRADGTGPVIQTGPELTGTRHWVWSPDSSKILMYPNDDSSPYAYLLDPDGGPWTTVPWQSDADLDWQRVAP